MFFTHFVFALSYRPGSQNVKADTLSQLYDTEERSMDPTPILSLIPSLSPNHPQLTIGSFIPLLSHVTIPQVFAVNENVFSVKLPGKIRVK